MTVYLVESWEHATCKDEVGPYHPTTIWHVASYLEGAKDWCRENSNFCGTKDTWHWVITEQELDNEQSPGPGEHWLRDMSLRCNIYGCLLKDDIENKDNGEPDMTRELITLTCAVAETNRQLGDLIEESKRTRTRLEFMSDALLIGKPAPGSKSNKKRKKK
jgi:hypothetical protein